MLKHMLSIAIAVMFTFNSYAEDLTFGEPVNEAEIVKISTILKSPAQYLDKPVTIEGTIVGVCAKRGCWVDIASDARFEKLRIKVRDGDMVFPMTAKGSKAISTGMLTEIKLDLAHTRQYKAHLAKRLGEELDVETITEPMSLYQLSPTGVKILD